MIDYQMVLVKTKHKLLVRVSKSIVNFFAEEAVITLAPFLVCLMVFTDPEVDDTVNNIWKYPSVQ